MRDELGHGAAGGGSLLRTVAGEAVGEIEVGEVGMGADDGVLIERVVVVVAGPRVDHLDGGKRRHTPRKAWPHLAVEEIVVDGLEVAGRRLPTLLRGLAAD